MADYQAKKRSSGPVFGPVFAMPAGCEDAPPGVSSGKTPADGFAPGLEDLVPDISERELHLPCVHEYLPRTSGFGILCAVEHRFNIAGQCIPGKHYMLPARMGNGRLYDIKWKPRK